MTQEELEKKMAVLLGGRAAEQLVFGHLSTGAADDLVRTTDIARSMVTRYGMVPELGHVAYDRDRPGFLGGPGGCPPTAPYSEQTAQAIDAAVRGSWTRRSRRPSASWSGTATSSSAAPDAAREGDARRGELNALFARAATGAE